MKIFYDGDCYFCKNYVQLLRLKQVVGEVELISFRSSCDEVRFVSNLGLNVNAGFVVIHNEKILHGAEAFDYLNCLVEPSNIFNRTLQKISGHKTFLKLLYPLMVLGRLLLLAIQGGALIDLKNGAREDGNGDMLLIRTIRLTPAFIVALATIRLSLFGSVSSLHFGRGGVYVILVLSVLLWFLLYLKDAYAKLIANKLLSMNLTTLLIYMLSWFVTVNLFDLISFRRISGFLWLLPLLVIAFEIGRKYKSRLDVGFIPAWTPFAILLFAFFPGLYIAPFYGGIAGWTLEIDLNKPVSISGYKLVNERGEMIWYNHAFFQPVSMDGRLHRAFIKVDPTNSMFTTFMIENYKNIYPLIERENMPHEWLLGKLAYPTHNLSKSNAADYIENFHPNNLVGVQYVTEYYSRAGDRVNVENGKFYPTGKNE